jgi:hypothetical protein
MFVYRFQYGNGFGIYNNGISFYERARKKANAVIECLRLYRYYMDYKGDSDDIHPKFDLTRNDNQYFGFNSIEQFESWFPEDLLKQILRVKSRRLKFCVFKTTKESDVRSDSNQCQFYPDKSIKVIECHMGCVNIKLKKEK